MILLTVVATASADTVVESVRERLSMLTEAVSSLYANPAVKPLQYKRPLTSLGIGVESDRGKTASVKAETYRHFGSSTVWGNASYSFGEIEDGGVMSLSVTPDGTADPYLPATDRSDEFSSERYAFMGGYGLTKGRWSYGATLSYDAWLSYRSVDPRPKNVSGTLCVTAGTAMTICPHRYIAAHLSYERYTQTSSVMFVSQQGADPVYHLTGLGTRYRRFDGQGWKTVYGGNRFLSGLATYPHDKGVVATVEMLTGSVSTVLADINNLPMCRLRQYGVTAQAGYMAQQWYAGGHGEVAEANGTENIFGDPVASVYPVIASQKSYANRYITLGVNGVRQYGAFTLSGDVSYRSQSERYYADNRSLSLHTLTARAGLQWRHLFGNCLVWAEGSGWHYAPIYATLQLPVTDAQSDPVGTRLAQEISKEFAYADSAHLCACVSANVAVPVGRVALTAGAAAERTRFNSFKLYLSVCF